MPSSRVSGGLNHVQVRNHAKLAGVPGADSTAKKRGLWLLADEVYDRLWYETETLGTAVPSILRKTTRDDAVMVVHSFSKSYCMTGWRLGWLIACADLAAQATQLNEFIVSHAPSFTQKAGETALRHGEPEIAAMLHRLKSNGDFCLAALAEMPRLTVPRPEGAFYLFPRVEGLTDSFDFCRRLLLETKVGIAPGSLSERAAKAQSGSVTLPTGRFWNPPWSGSIVF